MYISIDGYSADEDNGMRDVMMSIDDPEQEEYFVSRLSEAGTLIMGRVSCEIMAGFWPTSSHPSAGLMKLASQALQMQSIAWRWSKK